MNLQQDVHRGLLLTPIPVVHGDCEYTFYRDSAGQIRAYRSYCVGLVRKNERVLCLDLPQALQAMFCKFAGVESVSQLEWDPKYRTPKLAAAA
jgi:hypothetical protein